MGGVMARQQAKLPPRVRALLGFVCVLVLVDTMFFTALTPLLPHYVRAAGLSKAGAGILVAAYPFGTLVGALPGGLGPHRVELWRWCVGGSRLRRARPLRFAWPRPAPSLAPARFVQGLGG